MAKNIFRAKDVTYLLEHQALPSDSIREMVECNS
jgi:hypothetical protein